MDQAEKDGSEVKSVKLDRQGISLIERRNAFEFVRDRAAELYEAATGSAWRPHTGSMVNHRALTASVNANFLRPTADTEVLAPAGTRIAFTDGADCNDHTRIWAALDNLRPVCRRADTGVPPLKSGRSRAPIQSDGPSPQLGRS